MTDTVGDVEMEFQDTSRRRRRLLFVIGALLAIVAGFLAFTIGRGPSDSAKPPERSAVVAAHDIASRSVLQAGDLSVTQVPDVPSNTTAFTDVNQLVGQVTTVPLTAGQIVYPNVLVTTATGANFSILDPGEALSSESPEWRAISVMVPKDRAVAGDILAGQHVDLYVTVQIDVLVQNATGDYVNQPSASGETSGKSTKIVFQDLEVLESKPDDDMYVLKVNSLEAEQIYHVAAVAPSSFSLSLRTEGDSRQADTTDYGETNDRLIGEYVFPVPRLIDLGGGVIGVPTSSSTPLPSESPSATPLPSAPAGPTTSGAPTSPAPTP